MTQVASPAEIIDLCNAHHVQMFAVVCSHLHQLEALAAKGKKVAQSDVTDALKVLKRIFMSTDDIKSKMKNLIDPETVELLTAREWPIPKAHLAVTLLLRRLLDPRSAHVYRFAGLQLLCTLLQQLCFEGEHLCELLGYAVNLQPFNLPQPRISEAMSSLDVPSELFMQGALPPTRTESTLLLKEVRPRY